MSQKRAKKGRQASLLPWMLLAASVVAAAAVAYALLGTGGRSAAEGPMPYVGDDLHAIAVDPRNPERVMVGGHESAAISENGGKSWKEVPGLQGADPMDWAINPNDPREMYAGGHPGFFRSESGGKSWSMDNSGLPGTDVHALGMDPSNPDTLYAYVVNEGIYRSTDAGESWERVNASASAMGPIMVDPQDSKTLYLSDMRGNFLESEDGGKSWRQVGTIPGGMAMWVSQAQQKPDTFYAANGGVYKSTDGGESWRQVGQGLPGGVSVVSVAPSNPRIVYAAALSKEGVLLFRSEDGGQSWEAQNR